MTRAVLTGRRIAVIGSSGAGKSTLARHLAAGLGVDLVELDALNWRPRWRSLAQDDPSAWEAAVTAAASGEAWVMDGNYLRTTAPRLLARASDVVWLDYSRAVVMSRVVRRSFARALSGGELWPGTGNRESFRRWLRRDHPIRWTWDTYRSANREREALLLEAERAGLGAHRLSSPRAARAWLHAVAPV